MRVAGISRAFGAPLQGEFGELTKLFYQGISVYYLPLVLEMVENKGGIIQLCVQIHYPFPKVVANMRGDNTMDNTEGGVKHGYPLISTTGGQV